MNERYSSKQRGVNGTYLYSHFILNELRHQSPNPIPSIRFTTSATVSTAWSPLSRFFVHSISPRTCIACHLIAFSSDSASSRSFLGPCRTRIPGYPGLEIPRRDSNVRMFLRFVVDSRWWNQIIMTKLCCCLTGCSGTVVSALDWTDGVCVGIESMKDSIISFSRSAVDEQSDERRSFRLDCSV